MALVFQRLIIIMAGIPRMPEDQLISAAFVLGIYPINADTRVGEKLILCYHDCIIGLQHHGYQKGIS